MTQTVFRRALRIRLQGEQTCVADLEDDHHRFRVTACAAGGHLAAVRGEALRNPWSLCPAAVDQLQALVGLHLSGDPTALAGKVDPRLQCTHLFDLAGLAAAALARGGPALRRYDVSLAAAGAERWAARLVRDDGFELAWTVGVDRILGPEPFTDAGLKATFVDWARWAFPDDAFEAALVLRRAAFVGRGRFRADLDTRANAAVDAVNLGGCFVMQPERVHQALRVRGASRTFDVGGPLSEP